VRARRANAGAGACSQPAHPLSVQGVSAPWKLDPYVRIRVRTKTNGVYYTWHLTLLVPDAS